MTNCIKMAVKDILSKKKKKDIHIKKLGSEIMRCKRQFKQNSCSLNNDKSKGYQGFMKYKKGAKRYQG